jgi:hypothetical protein
MMDLYAVTTIAKKFGPCRNVTLQWFLCEPTQSRPYAELIDGYDPGEYGVYTVGAIDELFSWDQALTLKDYLDRNFDNATTTFRKVALPFPSNRMGIGAMAVGGGNDFHMLDKHPSYTLPFKVWGYYSLVGCELADGSGEKFRHYLLLVSEDGCRHETQEEVRRREASEARRMAEQRVGEFRR